MRTDVCVEVQMSVNKLIKFYQFEAQPSFLNNSGSRSTFDILCDFLEPSSTYTLNYENEAYCIDIIDIKGSIIFGACSRENAVKITNFWQVRNNKTLERTPYTSEMSDSHLETYTYFLIDTKKNRMAAIMQKSISSLHNILKEFIYKESNNMLQIYIAPEKIKDVKKAAKSLKQSTWLKLQFAKGRSKENIASLVETLGDFEYESYSVNIKLSQKDNSFIDRVFSVSHNKKDDFASIQLIGKNEYGLDETINFIESVYTKNMPFELTDDSATNIDYIEQRLIDALSQ